MMFGVSIVFVIALLLLFLFFLALARHGLVAMCVLTLVLLVVGGSVLGIRQAQMPRRADGGSGGRAVAAGPGTRAAAAARRRSAPRAAARGFGRGCTSARGGPCRRRWSWCSSTQNRRPPAAWPRSTVRRRSSRWRRLRLRRTPNRPLLNWPRLNWPRLNWPLRNWPRLNWPLPNRPSWLHRCPRSLRHRHPTGGPLSRIRAWSPPRGSGTRGSRFRLAPRLGPVAPSRSRGTAGPGACVGSL